jgi:hypothetical protein
MDVHPLTERRILRAMREAEQQIPLGLPEQATLDALPWPVEFVRFQLSSSALTPGGTAQAYRLYYDGGIVVTDTEITVVDELGLHRGRATDAYGSPHNLGSRGLAWKCFDREEYAILWMQPAALWLRGVTEAAVNSTDATFELDSHAVAQPIGGLICDQDPGDTITVQNIHDWDIDSGASVLAAWNEAATQWEAVQVTCPA